MTVRFVVPLSFSDLRRRVIEHSELLEGQDDDFVDAVWKLRCLWGNLQQQRRLRRNKRSEKVRFVHEDSGNNNRRRGGGGVTKRRSSSSGSVAGKKPKSSRSPSPRSNSSSTKDSLDGSSGSASNGETDASDSGSGSDEDEDEDEDEDGGNEQDADAVSPRGEEAAGGAAAPAPPSASPARRSGRVKTPQSYRHMDSGAASDDDADEEEEYGDDAAPASTRTPRRTSSNGSYSKLRRAPRARVNGARVKDGLSASSSTCATPILDALNHKKVMSFAHPSVATDANQGMGLAIQLQQQQRLISNQQLQLQQLQHQIMLEDPYPQLQAHYQPQYQHQYTATYDAIQGDLVYPPQLQQHQQLPSPPQPLVSELLNAHLQYQQQPPQSHPQVVTVTSAGMQLPNRAVGTNGHASGHVNGHANGHASGHHHSQGRLRWHYTFPQSAQESPMPAGTSSGLQLPQHLQYLPQLLQTGPIIDGPTTVEPTIMSMMAELDPFYYLPQQSYQQHAGPSNAFRGLGEPMKLDKFHGGGELGDSSDADDTASPVSTSSDSEMDYFFNTTDMDAYE